MAEQLNNVLKQVIQRTSNNINNLANVSDRALFLKNIAYDLANIIQQIDQVYYPLFSSLISQPSLNALEYGLSGNIIKTNADATISSSAVYWNSVQARPASIKETTDILLGEITRLENLVDQIRNAIEYDDSELRDGLDLLTKNLEQVTLDTMGTEYSLTALGEATLEYSLSQAIDAIGTFFGGFPSTGNSYSTTFPNLTKPVTTLQEAYDALETEAGTLVLNNTQGGLKLNGEAGLGIVLDVQSDSFTRFSVEPEKVKVETPLLLLSVTEETIPTLDATYGQLLSVTIENDDIENELCYSSDLNTVQLTYRGRVMEYEMGSQFIPASDFVPMGMTPSLQTITLGASPATDMAYKGLVFAGAGAAETAYFYISVPHDLWQTGPQAFLLNILTIPITAGGGGAVRYTLAITQNDPAGLGGNTDAYALLTGDSVVPSWDNDSPLQGSLFNDPADLNKIIYFSQTILLQNLASSTLGFLPFKVTRDSANVADTFTGSIAIIGAHITWYRRA